MGKIYKNDVSYSSSTNVATNINYDNSKSSIAAGNIQGAIDEIIESSAITRTITQEEYNALPDTKYTDGVEYFIEDAPSLSAKGIPYDGTKTHTEAQNVQDAIDDLSEKVFDSEEDFNRAYSQGELKEGDTFKYPSSSIPAGPLMNSYIGMIIHTTTLNTQDKVKEIYGGTSWLLHSGYVLRGASTNVEAGVAGKTGGNDNAVAVNHSHSYTPAGTIAIKTNAAVTSSGGHTTVAGGGHTTPSTGTCSITSSGGHTHTITAKYASKDCGGTGKTRYGTEGTSTTTGLATIASDTGKHTHTVPNHTHTVSNHTHTVSDHTHTMTQAAYTFTGTPATITLTGEDGIDKNIPAYKSVYIWERTA